MCNWDVEHSVRCSLSETNALICIIKVFLSPVTLLVCLLCFSRFQLLKLHLPLHCHCPYIRHSFSAWVGGWDSDDSRRNGHSFTCQHFPVKTHPLSVVDTLLLLLFDTLLFPQLRVLNIICDCLCGKQKQKSRWKCNTVCSTKRGCQEIRGD